MLPAWLDFLASLRAEDRLNLQQAKTACRLWEITTQLRAPTAITQLTKEGALQMAWNKQEQYLDIEVLPDCKLVWFYRDRVTGLVEGSGEMPISFGRIPLRFFRRLRSVAAAA